jgi:hypothetical protein
MTHEGRPSSERPLEQTRSCTAASGLRPGSARRRRCRGGSTGLRGRARASGALQLYTCARILGWEASGAHGCLRRIGSESEGPKAHERREVLRALDEERLLSVKVLDAVAGCREICPPATHTFLNRQAPSWVFPLQGGTGLATVTLRRGVRRDAKGWLPERFWGPSREAFLESAGHDW